MSVLVAAATAGAQSVTLSPTIRRVVSLRDQGTKRYWISRKDCLADDVITFSEAVLLNAGAYELQVWAGPSVDCSDVNNRKADNGPCWLVGTAETQVTPVNIQVRARDVVGHNFANAGNWGVGSGTIDDCNSESAGVTGSTISLYFLLLSGGSTSVGTPTVWPKTDAGYTFGYDLVGPDAPTKVSAGVGENLLVVSWDISAANDLRSFKIYCDPKSSNAPPSTTKAVGGAAGTASGGTDAGSDAASGGGTVATDSGVGGAAGTTGTGGGGGNENCPSTALMPGQAPPLDYECGSAGGKTSSDGNAEGLENGTIYAIGVSAVDDVGNAGPLSEIACGTPAPVNDFFELYRRAGGKGGGGFCALGHDPSPGVWMLLGTGLGALLLRRRRPKP